MWSVQQRLTASKNRQWNNAWIWAQSNKDPRLPWTSLSFRNHLMLAAGLLPDVVHVSVISSPSMAGSVNPVIAGRPGTPVFREDINTNNIQDTHLAISHRLIWVVFLWQQKKITNWQKFLLRHSYHFLTNSYTSLTVYFFKKVNK